MSKKIYIKPELTIVKLDNSISLAMMSSWKPGDGKPPYPPGKPDRPDHPLHSNSFESPFSDTPFN